MLHLTLIHSPTLSVLHMPTLPHRYFQHAHFMPIVNVGKRVAHINWFIVRPAKVAPVTGTTLRTAGSVPTDSRQ